MSGVNQALYLEPPAMGARAGRGIARPRRLKGRSYDTKVQMRITTTWNDQKKYDDCADMQKCRVNSKEVVSIGTNA